MFWPAIGNTPGYIRNIYENNIGCQGKQLAKKSIYCRKLLSIRERFLTRVLLLSLLPPGIVKENRIRPAYKNYYRWRHNNGFYYDEIWTAKTICQTHRLGMQQKKKKNNLPCEFVWLSINFTVSNNDRQSPKFTWQIETLFCPILSLWAYMTPSMSVMIFYRSWISAQRLAFFYHNSYVFNKENTHGLHGSHYLHTITGICFAYVSKGVTKTIT